jgi:hypothetical protein
VVFKSWFRSRGFSEIRVFNLRLNWIGQKMSFSQQKSSPPEQGAFRPRPHSSGIKKAPATPRPGWVFARCRRCCRRHRPSCRRSCRRYRRRPLTRRRQEPVSLIDSLRRRESLRRDWRHPLPSSPRLHLCWSQALSKPLQVRSLYTVERGVTKRCRLYWPTNSALVYEPIGGGGGGGELRGLSQ